MLRAGWILALLAGAGCAGYRGGQVSVPYAEGVPERSDHELVFPGVSLRIAPGNQRETVDAQWVGLGLSVVRRPAPRAGATPQVLAHPFPLQVSVTPHTEGFTFDPRNLLLSVEGRMTLPLACEQQAPDARPVLNAVSGPELPLPIALAPDRTHTFVVFYALAAPTPDQEFSLDLAEALVGPTHEKWPLVKFKAADWRQWYRLDLLSSDPRPREPARPQD